LGGYAENEEERPKEVQIIVTEFLGQHKAVPGMGDVAGEPPKEKRKKRRESWMVKVPFANAMEKGVLGEHFGGESRTEKVPGEKKGVKKRRENYEQRKNKG